MDLDNLIPGNQRNMGLTDKEALEFIFTTREKDQPIDTVFQLPIHTKLVTEVANKSGSIDNPPIGIVIDEKMHIHGGGSEPLEITMTINGESFTIPGGDGNDDFYTTRLENHEVFSRLDKIVSEDMKGKITRLRIYPNLKNEKMEVNFTFNFGHEN